MKTTYLLLFVAFALLSCSKENLLMDDDSKDFLNISPEDIPDIQQDPTFDFDIALSVGKGKGIQMINDNQTNDELERGVGVPIPLFSDETVEVKTGTWVTLRFGLGDILGEGGECPEEVSGDEIESLLSDVIQSADDLDLKIYFDGEEIELAPYFRKEGFYTYVDRFGDCRYQFPWRYYITPQVKGDYEFKFMFNGVGYTRTISWVPGKKR